MKRLPNSLMKPSNDSAASVIGRDRKLTTCQSRIKGNPTTSSATNDFPKSSSLAVCSERNAKPMLAITACLIDSLQGNSITSGGEI
jgi:hypothetical protein